MAITNLQLGKKNIKVDTNIRERLSLANMEKLRATGTPIDVNQAFRTTEQQAKLFKELSAKGARVAPPGKSFHEKGLAVDVTNWQESEPYLRKYGLVNDLSGDKGHFSAGETNAPSSLFQNFNVKVDESRKSGKTDTDILNFIGQRDPLIGQKIQKSRTLYGKTSGISNDRDLLNYLSIRYSGQMPSVPSVPLKEVEQARILTPKEKVEQKIKQDRATTEQKIASVRNFLIDEIAKGGAKENKEDGFLKSMAKTIFQTTIGSKGLAGVAQMPGKVVNTYLNTKEQQLLSESQSRLMDLTMNAIKMAREETDPVKKERLMNQVRNNVKDLGLSEDVYNKLQEGVLTPGQAIGTTINAALTAASMQGGLLKTGVSSQKPLISQAIGKGLGKVLPSRLLTAKNALLPRIATGIAEATGYTAGYNIGEGKPVGEGMGLAVAFGGGLPIAGQAIVAGRQAIGTQGRKLGGRLVNSLLKPNMRQFSYGKNPGRGVVEEGITGNSLEDLVDNIAKRRQEIGQLKGLLAKESNAKIDASDILDPIFELSDELSKTPATNKALLNRLDDIFDDLVNNLRGKNLKNLSVEETDLLKQLVGGMSKWTGNPSDDQLINKTLHKIYGNLRGKIEQKVPTMGAINERYGDLLSAEQAGRYRMNLTQRFNIVGLGTKIGTLGGAIVGSISSGGSIIPSILAGASVGALDKALGSTAVKSRVGAWLAKSTPAEREFMYKSVPALREAIDIVFGETAGKAKNIPVGLSIEPISTKGGEKFSKEFISDTFLKLEETNPNFQEDVRKFFAKKLPLSKENRSLGLADKLVSDILDNPKPDSRAYQLAEEFLLGKGFTVEDAIKAEQGLPAGSLSDAKEALKKAKGLSAADIMKKHPDINLKRDVSVTDIYGKKKTIPAGEALTPYELKGNKVLLQDGETYIVSKNQAQNVINNSVKEGAIDFAPELKGLEETVKGAGSWKGDEYIANGQTIANLVDNGDGTWSYQSDLSEGSDVFKTRREAMDAALEEITDPYAESGTKYSKYTLPGGENYKEILIKAPEKKYTVEDLKPLENQGWSFKKISDDIVEPTNPQGEKEARTSIEYLLGGNKGTAFKSSHWDELNVGGWIMAKERTIPGTNKKAFFVEETQDVISEGHHAEEATDFINKAFGGRDKFNELKAKRELIEAVNSDADYIAWANGEQISAKYNLSTSVDNIDWGGSNLSNRKIIDIQPKGDRTSIRIEITPEGNIYKSDKSDWQGKKLDEVLGKGLADKIMSKETGTLSDEGLKFGGEWADTLYGKPGTTKSKIGNIYEKLTGGKVEIINLSGGDAFVEQKILDLENAIAYDKKILKNKYDFIDRGHRSVKEVKDEIATKEKELERLRNMNQQAIRLTPEIKAKIQGKSLLQKKPSGKSPF